MNDKIKKAKLVQNGSDNKPSYFEFSYEDEMLQDTILREIKDYCLNYLLDKNNIKMKSLAELIKFRDFTESKFKYYNSLKKSLKLNTHGDNIVVISQLLGALTMSSDLSYSSSSINKSTIYLIQKEMDHIIDKLSFCYGILLMCISNKDYI